MTTDRDPRTIDMLTQLADVLTTTGDPRPAQPGPVGATGFRATLAAHELPTQLSPELCRRADTE